MSKWLKSLVGSFVLHFNTLLLLLGETFRRAKVINFSFSDENFARRIVSPDETQLYRCCWTSLLTSHICIHIRTKGLLTQLLTSLPCVSITIKYLHRCPPQQQQQHHLQNTTVTHSWGNIYTDAHHNNNNNNTTSKTPPSHYLHRCLKTKDLCVENNTLFTQMSTTTTPHDVTHLWGYQNCSWSPNSILLTSTFWLVLNHSGNS